MDLTTIISTLFFVLFCYAVSYRKPTLEEEGICLDSTKNKNKH